MATRAHRERHGFLCLLGLLESGCLRAEAVDGAVGDAIPTQVDELMLYPRIQCVLQN